MAPSPSHESRLKVERISFPDTGDWWDIRSVLSVGLDREFSEIAFQSQSLLRGEVTDAAKALAERMDDFLLRCTVAWSYGEVNEAVLHQEVPADHYQVVGDKMVELYIPLVLKRLETLLNASSLPSSPGAVQDSPSQTSSPNPT